MRDSQLDKDRICPIGLRVEQPTVYEHTAGPIKHFGRLTAIGQFQPKDA